MHQTTFIPHRLQNAYRRWMAGAALLTAVTLSSCQKNESIMPMPEEAPTRATMMEVSKPGGLIQQADGTWKTVNCRVPLVGPGRIVNDIHEQVDVLTFNTKTIGNIVDINLNNFHSTPATVKAGLVYSPITSVKDLHRVYAAGQKVGFVYKDEAGSGLKLLNIDLLNSLSLTTYLRGKKQESSIQSQGGSAIKLDLLALNNGTDIANRIISFEATKPFDEVVLGTQGVNAEAASTISLAIKYAFVGENPEIRATSEAQFVNFWTGGTPKAKSQNTPLWENDNKITDDDLTNHVNSSLLGGVLAYSSVTLDFKREIPAGAEVGFYYSNEKLLGLDLLKAPGGYLYTYKNNSVTDKAEPSADLLSLSLIGSGKTLVSMNLTKPCNKLEVKVSSGLLSSGLDVGIAHYYYAYVRESIKLDPINEFTFGNDTTYSNSYRLPAAEQGNVQYLVLASPYGSNPRISDVGKNNVLNGMTHDGSYRVQALYTSATDGRQVSHIATIYRKTESRKQGNTYITARSHGAYATEPIGWQGSLLSLFQGTNNLNNVVDMEQENYATAYKLANVLELEEPVAAFQWNKPIGGNGQNIRTGFVVRAQNHLLDLTALTFFQIRLYKDGKLVDTQGGTKNSAVKLGLLGSSENDKVRISIVTNKVFDRMELWQKGVASVLDNIRLYHIFYEDSTCDPTTEVGGGLELLTNIKDGLVVNYEHTLLGGLLAVGDAATDLSKMLDGSIKSGTVIRTTAGAAGATTISLSFKRRAANQPVGIILGEMPSLLDLGLIDVNMFKVYNGNKEVVSTNKVGILGSNLISLNGRTYIEETPSEDFDRVVFTIASGLTLLENSKICGVYSRNLENTKGYNKGQLTINDGIYHACYGAELNINIINTSLVNGTQVSLYCEDIYNPTVYQRIEARIIGENLVIAAQSLPVGRYKITVSDMQGVSLTNNSKLFVYIHPLMTIWKRDASTTNWNEWENWMEGSPWNCTDVIIPSDANRYPELKGNETNACANIHFESGAEVVGTQHLTMNGKAYVDLSLQGGRNYLLSAPLQEMYTGDMFINPNVPEGKDNYFIPLSIYNYPEKRTSPIIYQRFWSRTATEKVVGINGNLENVDVSTAEWSQEFNAVAEKYTQCQGFSLRAGKTDDFNSYMLRFPKTHETYQYYTHGGVATGKTETITRNGFGRLNNMPSSVTLTNQAGNTFLMGNPMMCHLDVAKFLTANNTSVSHILVYDGNSYNPIIDVNGQLISSQTTDNLLIAPMEAFFVVTKTDSRSLNITLNEDMFRQKATTENTTRKVKQSAQSFLRITAVAAGEVASCVVVQSPRASNEYCIDEDAHLLIDSEQHPTVAIFTQAGKETLSIQQIKEATRIPLGLLMKHSGSATLEFETNGTEWNYWQLTDSLTGKNYPLRGKIQLDQVSNGSNRFYLNKTTK